MTVQSLKKRVGSLPPAVWMIAVMLVFLATVFIPYVYAWRKGVFRWR